MLQVRNMGSMSRRGGIVQGCIVVVVILLVLGIIGAIIIAMNARGWAASAMSAVAKEAVNQSNFPAAEKPEIIAVFDEATDAFRNKQITLEELGTIFENLEQSNAFGLGLVMEFEGGSIDGSGLTAEEKTDAKLQLNRVAQGLASDQISGSEARQVLGPVMANGEVNDGSTDEQVRSVVANAKAAADKVGIPAERDEIDLSEEFREYIEGALGRKIGEAPAGG